MQCASQIVGIQSSAEYLPHRRQLRYVADQHQSIALLLKDKVKQIGEQTTAMSARVIGEHRSFVDHKERILLVVAAAGKLVLAGHRVGRSLVDDLMNGVGRTARVARHHLRRPSGGRHQKQLKPKRRQGTDQRTDHGGLARTGVALQQQNVTPVAGLRQENIKQGKQTLLPRRWLVRKVRSNDLGGFCHRINNRSPYHLPADRLLLPTGRPAALGWHPPGRSVLVLPRYDPSLPVPASLRQ